MPIYQIEQLEIVKVKYDIEANSKEEALQFLLEDGAGECAEIEQTIDSFPCDDYGMSLEEAEEQGIDLRLISDEYINKNHGYIKSIASIYEKEE